MFCTVIKESNVGILEVFGKYEDIYGPGCHCFKVPCVSNIIGTLSTRVHCINSEVATKTKDNVFVTLVVCTNLELQKDPEKIYAAFYKFHNLSVQLQLMVEDVVRGVVPSIEIDELFVQKDTISKFIKERLEKDLNASGYDILSSLILDILPDRKVVEAINNIEVNRCKRLSEAENSEANKYIGIKKAEAQSEATYLLGWGLSKQRSAIVDGLRDSMEKFSDSVNVKQKEIMNLITITQYFDSLKDISGQSQSEIYLLPRKTLQARNPELDMSSVKTVAPLTGAVMSKIKVSDPTKKKKVYN